MTPTTSTMLSPVRASSAALGHSALAIDAQEGTIRQPMSGLVSTRFLPLTYTFAQSLVVSVRNATCALASVFLLTLWGCAWDAHPSSRTFEIDSAELVAGAEGEPDELRIVLPEGRYLRDVTRIAPVDIEVDDQVIRRQPRWFVEDRELRMILTQGDGAPLRRVRLVSDDAFVDLRGDELIMGTLTLRASSESARVLPAPQDQKNELEERLAAGCSGCHGEGGALPALELDALTFRPSRRHEAFDVITPGAPERSTLVLMLLPDYPDWGGRHPEVGAGWPGEPTPFATDAELARSIAAWIRDR